MPKFIEFFSGMGGLAVAGQGLLQVESAFDQDFYANATYALNLGQRPRPLNIRGLVGEELCRTAARGWLLSPPCQPYTRKGRGWDLDDPRAGSLLRLIELLPESAPDWFFLENVPPFADSRARLLLLQALSDLDLRVIEVQVCPTQFGIPNRRQRHFVLARHHPFGPQPERPRFQRTLDDYLDPTDQSSESCLSEEFESRNRASVHRVESVDDVTACFGSSYGHARCKAGSYLCLDGGFRRFSPKEILNLLHFPPDFRFPEGMPPKTCYRLAGNSVNVEVARHLLRWLIRP